MNRYLLARLALLTSAFAFATLVIGWWAVPAIAIAWGILDREETVPVVATALAAGLGWGALLAWDSKGGQIGLLGHKLGVLLHQPPAMLYAATLLFPTILAGSAVAAAKGLSRLTQYSTRPTVHRS